MICNGSTHLHNQGMPRALASIFALMLFALPGTPLADQDDPRLDGKFAQLRAAESPERIQRLTREIWNIWRDHEREEVTEAMDRAGVALRAGEFARAEEELDAVVEMAPDFAEGWNQRATVRFLRGRYEASAADVRRVLALEPRHFGALEGLGLIYLELDLPEAALGAFERALEVHPHLPGARERIRMLRRGLSGESS